LKSFLKNVIKDAITYTEYAKRNTMTLVSYIFNLYYYHYSITYYYYNCCTEKTGDDVIKARTEAIKIIIA